MTGGKIIRNITVWKEGPAEIAAQALTAEAVWQHPEHPVARTKTAAGTEAASNVATFSENNYSSTASDPIYQCLRGNMAIEKIIFLAQDHQTFKGHTAVEDQRASKRFNHEASLIIKNCDCGTYAYGRMYNYSRGGIYFESDTAFKPGTCVRIDIEEDIEETQNSLAVSHYYAAVMWCKEISEAVVLYDYGIGIEFTRGKNRTTGTAKLRIIQGGADQNGASDLFSS